jgi:hypothetical protein
VLAREKGPAAENAGEKKLEQRPDRIYQVVCMLEENFEMTRQQLVSAIFSPSAESYSAASRFRRGP